MHKILDLFSGLGGFSLGLERTGCFKTKEDTMNKVKDYMATFFGVVFIMSMVGATGAIEADNYLVGFVMALVGSSTGILTLILQSKEDY